MEKKQGISQNAKKQQELFNSEFGKQYTDRNLGTNDGYARWLYELCGELGVKSVLEAGCNSGGNLALVAGDPSMRAAGVDMQEYALGLARKNIPNAEFKLANLCERIPFDDASFDLVFTCGVLIHIPPQDVPAAMEEIHRVAKKYVVVAEYEDDAMKEIVWRGLRNSAWKGPYRRMYLDRFPGLKQVRKGHLGPADDKVVWYVLQKTS